MSRCRIDLVIGTRPNIVKVGPLAHLLVTAHWCEVRIVFLEQHTSSELADNVLDDLGVDAAHVLRIPLSAAEMGARLGEMVAGYARALDAGPPDLVVVFGDVDTTLAATIAAKRAQLQVAHVEAGLRSHDRGMPEELNRLMVDAVCDLYFTTTEEASQTLVGTEGKDPARVFFVGNLMIDSLVRTVDEDHGRLVAARLGLAAGAFAIATFHRPSNVDAPGAAGSLLKLLAGVAERIPVLLPAHPRTSAAWRRHGLWDHARAIPGLQLVGPLRYRDFISLVSQARLAITDSGGLQEETSFLGVPCLTYRENTERPITLTTGTNRLVGPADLLQRVDEVLAAAPPVTVDIPMWDGTSAWRIADRLHQWWGERADGPTKRAGLHAEGSGLR